MIWNTVYVELAIHLSNMVSDCPYAWDHVRSALTTVIDVDTSESDGQLVAVEILPLIRDLHRKVYETWDHNFNIRMTLEKINEFTTTYYGDLTTFVNSLSWPDGCVPYVWGTYSDEAGYDITEWSVCS